MADLQITGLPALAEAGIQATDVAAVADISATETKKVTIKDLIAAGVALIDDADIPAAKVGTLGTNQVSSAAIQAGAVVAAKIASGTITAAQIADATITGAKLVNDTVTATQIAANAITASELADDAVDEAAIVSNAVTVNKIANTTVTYAKLNLSDGDIPGAKIATGGITATQLAANSVAASELADDAVDTAAIVDGAVIAAKIATNTITANQIAANAVTASELATDAVTTNKIQDGAVTAAKLSGTLAAASIADDAVTTAKILDDAVTSAKLAANAVDAAALADNAVDSGAIASSAVIEAKIASNAVTVTKIADGTITPAKLNTSNLDRSLNVASGNLGINNTITAATRSGITYNAQGLITATAALVAGDLPVATTSAVGGVSVGTGLSVSGAGALSLTNSVTGATVSGITFNNQGMITAATALTAANLPVATTSAKGAVQITSGGGLTVDGSGNLTTSTSGISAGTYQSITVNNKGVATAGAALTAGLIPDLAASKITSGSLDAARIGNDTIDGTKLSNTSTAIFQSIAQSGYPTAQFNGQLLFDTVSEDAYIWDGNAWQAITTLTKGSLVFGGNYNANTSKMTACTSAGLAAGLAVGSNLPTPSSTTDGLYVVVDTAGTPSAPAPVVAFSPPDYILGVTNASGSSWNEIDLSQTVAGQVASNITFTPYGQLSSTNVQDALQELETEKLALAGGTITGQVLIGNTGSLVFEGSTIDAYETTITVADPTSSDKTITFPDTTGTVITSGDTGTVTGTMLANGTIQNVDIHADAAIAFTKLADLTSAQILVGNGSNEPTAVAVTGDISINNAGLTSIASNVIVDADIKSDAAISGSKIVQGTTSVLGVLQLTDAADSTSTTTAATPAAVKTAKDAADAAATTANAALPKAGGTMTDNLLVDNDKEVRFFEADSNGSNYVGIKGATDKASSGSYTISLPAAPPTTGQVLKAGSTATTLEWAADSATDSTKMPLAGGTFTGDVTFTGDSSNGLWDKSASAFVANLTGTASIATSITVADESSDTTCFPLFATAATGDLGAKSGSNLTFNSSSGALTATSFVGALTGNVTGNVSGSAATVTGAAQSAITSLGTLTGLTVDGDLTLTGASANVTWDKSTDDLIFNDNAKAIFGTSSDGLELFHNGSHSVIKEAGTGALKVVTNSSFQVRNADEATGEYLINANVDGSVELYDNGSKKFHTHSTGVTVTGYLHIEDGSTGIGLGNSDDLKLFHDGSNSYITHDGTGNLIAKTTGADEDFYLQSGNDIYLQPQTNEEGIKVIGNGAVELYHNNVKKLTTYSTGIEVHGSEGADGEIYLYADEGDDDDDNWKLNASYDASRLRIMSRASGSWTTNIECNGNGNVELNHAGSKKFETKSYGVDLTGALVATGDIKAQTDGGKLMSGASDDLQIYHDGSNSWIKNTTGTLYVQDDSAVILGSVTSAETYVKGVKDGSVELFHDNSKKLETSSSGVTVTGTVSDSIGNLRTLGVNNAQGGAYTLVAADAGKIIRADNTVTLPVASSNVFSAGQMVSVLNNSSSAISLNSASGVALYNSATEANGNKSIAARGMVTIFFLAAHTAYVSGAGLSDA